MLKLMLNFLRRLGERGEGEAQSGGGVPPPESPSWYSQIPETMTVEHEGKSIPLRDHPTIKETPDVPTLAKRFYDNHKALGGAIRLPGKEAKPEEITALKSKLYQAGVFKAPPESPDKYVIDLSAIPEPLRNDETVQAVRTWAHKHSVSQDAMAELIALEGERYSQMRTVLDYDMAESQKTLETKAQQEGKSLKEVMAYGGAWLKKHLSQEGLGRLEMSGLANDPELAWLIAKAGMDTGEDISMLDGRSDPAVDAEYNEVQKIKNDPNHPDHKRWRNGDPAIVARFETAYRKKFGSGEYVPQGASE